MTPCPIIITGCINMNIYVDKYPNNHHTNSFNERRGPLHEQHVKYHFIAYLLSHTVQPNLIHRHTQIYIPIQHLLPVTQGPPPFSKHQWPSW